MTQVTAPGPPNKELPAILGSATVDLTHSTTVGGFLESLQRDRRGALVWLHETSSGIARRISLGRPRQHADVEDLAESMVVGAVADGGASLRRAPPGLPLVAWLVGIAKTVLRAERYRAARETAMSDEVEERLGSRVDDAPDEARSEPGDPVPPRRIRVDRLSPEQRRVFDALAAGLSERGAAEALHSSRDHVHDVKRRAIRRLRAASPPPLRRDRSDRSWAAAAADRADVRGHPLTATLLHMYAAGATRAEIAAATGLTPNAVKQRVTRARPGLDA